MFKEYDVLDHQEIQRIHDASLRVLEETGIFLDHPKAQEVLSGLGAKISDDKKKVYLNRDLVEKLLARAPKSFKCAGRRPELDLDMRQGNTYVRQVGGPICLYDMRCSTTRPLTLQDNIDSARLIDSLPHIDMSSALSPQDIDPETYDIAVVKALLENSNKHFWALTTHSSHLQYEMEMVEAVAGSKEKLRDRPSTSGIFCVIDPLRYPADEIDRLLVYGDYGLPVRVPITSLCGGNAPYTLAGTMVQINAEFLSSTAIIQALCPGLGIWYYTLLQTMDMNNGHSIATGPEIIILYSASAQMARHYGVPATFNSGALTDTQSHQAMYHYGTMQMMAALLRITEQCGAGSIQAAAYYSHQALVIINESMSYTRRIVEGFDISPEAMAVDDIAAMADKGEYLSSKLTLKSLRTEKRFKPTVLDWRTLSTWTSDPTTIVDRAEAEAQRLIAKAVPPEMPADIQRELDKIMKAAQREFSKA